MRYYSESIVRTGSDHDVLARVRARLLTYVDEAAEGARRSGRAVSLAAYYVRRRERLNRARVVLHSLTGTGDQERILHEAELAYLRRKGEFVDAPTSSSLVRAWTDLLVEATEKVEQDRRDAELFAAVGAQSTADDRGWEEGATRLAGDHWTGD